MNLLSAAAKISSLTMLSRITGLLRETLIARTYGASEWTDAFNVAFRIPNLLRRLFAEGAFSQAFVPVLGETATKEGAEGTSLMVSAIATLLFWALVITVLIGVLGAPWIIFMVASGFKSGGAYDASLILTRIMFPYIGLISMVSLSAGILNTYKKFAIPAFTPVLLNLSMIFSSWLLSPYFETPIYALGIGVILGGITQLGIQIPALRKIGLLPKIGLGFKSIQQAWRHPGAKKVLHLMIPALFAVSVAQLSLIINTNIASHLTSGSVSWLSYADRLMEFPTALLGVAIGTVLLPSLSKANALEDTEQMAQLMDWGLKLTFILATPAAIALFLFGQPLAAVLYHYGQFSALDVTMTQHALAAYGVGLIGLILVKILAPAYYSKQDIKTPVKIAIRVLMLTQIANIILVPWLNHAGLALSIGLGACLNALMLWRGLSQRGILATNAGWLKFFAKLSVGLVGVVIVFYLGAQQHDWIALKDTPLIRIGLMVLWLGLAATVYLSSLWLTGFRAKDFLFQAK
ncbi:MAG: murein biosynthesis integral membrane protein MurJ [Polynucleobacter sp.]|nr:MAG: murein biosynthesis integral membrane protein MurJ [Polynucleobacter sp.]